MPLWKFYATAFQLGLNRPDPLPFQFVTARLLKVRIYIMRNTSSVDKQNINK